MGWRIATAFMPASLAMRAMKRVTPLLPQPVLTAQTEITGFAESRKVFSAEWRTKSAPIEAHRDARSMMYSLVTSLYEKATMSIFLDLISAASISSGYMGMPAG